MSAPVTQCPRGTVRDSRSGLAIKKNAIIANSEQAWQFVAHDHDGGSKTVAQFHDQIVEPVGGNRIQSG